MSPTGVRQHRGAAGGGDTSGRGAAEGRPEGSATEGHHGTHSAVVTLLHVSWYIVTAVLFTSGNITENMTVGIYEWPNVRPCILLSTFLSGICMV